MVRFRILVVGVALALSACNGAVTGPVVSATPVPPPQTGDDLGEADTPNSFPSSSIISAPAEPETGVIGVRHLPP